MENNKYHRGKIYAIRSHQTQDVYIGSTCDRLSRRLSGHKTAYNKYLKNPSRKTSSYKILKYSDYYIELVEEFKCNNKMELNKREGEIIRTTPNCINREIAGRTSEEYYQDNKEEILKKTNTYYHNNKEKRQEWIEKNRPELEEKWRKYVKDNKEKRKLYNKIKDKCICGREYTRVNKGQHLNTKIHKDYLETI